MKLVIAEKPSVAQSLAAVLGAKERGQGYLQGNGYVVSWCVGHLIGLAAADAYDARYSKWCYEDLPIIPEEWKYTVAPDKKDQYEVLVSLMNRPDVESLVCATDAGREGELIFRLVYDHAGCTKPFERLWISSMEDSAIREGFENLRPGAEYDLLYEAALCRAKEYPMCRVTILNENGIPVTVEVSREIYQVFVDYEREVERQRKADFRHRDARSWDTCLIFEVSTETLEQTYERIRTWLQWHCKISGESWNTKNPAAEWKESFV